MLNDYPSIDLSTWKKVGEGGNGSTYTNAHEPGVILKVSHQEDGTIEVVSKEFHTSRAVYELGIPSPKMLELVRVEDGYGIKSELIANKRSIGRLCGENPEQIEQFAARMAQLSKQIHKTVVRDKTWIPSMKSLMLEALATTKMLSGRKRRDATEFVESLEDATTLLHGDFSMGNLIFEWDGQSISDNQSFRPYWIDLGRAVHGIPMFDLGHLYLFCNIFSKQKRVQEIAHMTDKQMVAFWNAFALAYNGKEGLGAFTAECKKFAALDVVLLGHIQTLNWHERLFLALLARSIYK